MATITYNSVGISNCRITRFSVENEFEGGAFNRTGRKCTMEGVGIIKETGSFTKLAQIRDALNKPRQTLLIQWDGASAATLSDGSTDARNGPLPTVNINEIHGGNTAAYVVGFTFVFYDCGSTPIQKFECIQRHTIDERGYLRINRSGSLTVSPQATSATDTISFTTVGATSINPYPGPQTTYNAGPNPDFYRRLVAGVCPPNFQRTKQEYYVDASLRTLVYDIEDRQLEWSLPKPVYDGDASFDYERSLDNLLGTKVFKVSFEAAYKDKMELLVLCIDTAMTRINFNGTNPDIIQSFKISEPSIFKGNMVTFEVVATGLPVNNETNDLGNNIDQNLKDMLFAAPYQANGVLGSTFPDVYGSHDGQTASLAISRTANLRYDPCLAGSGLVALLGDADIEVKIVTPRPDDESTGDDLPTKQPETDSDQTTRESAGRTLKYSSKQTISQKTGMTMLETMGGEYQFSFQTRLPVVIIVQSVEVVTTGQNIPIPWPETQEGAIVIDSNTSINDAPPDASGNRLYMISATRTLHVNVPLSQNTTLETIPTTAGQNLTDGGSSAVVARVWSPTSVRGPRTPFGTPAQYNTNENLNGDEVRQSYYNRA